MELCTSGGSRLKKNSVAHRGAESILTLCGIEMFSARNALKDSKLLTSSNLKTNY